MEDLKAKAIRGGVVKFGGQIAILAIRLGYIVVMARLLDPVYFGLVAMVLVVTGVFELFSTGGLSTATVQQETISTQQVSNLFWINLLIGAVLAVACVATAPVLVALYHEERLFWIAFVVGAGFLLTGAGVQHMALLQRQLSYAAVTYIEVGAQLLAAALGVSLVVLGFSYWGLVLAAVATPSLNTVFCWLATRWVPDRPRGNIEIASMLRFGGTLTLNGLVIYFAYNFDKFLLGRYWGADALGSYGRAYQLINIPTQALNAAIGVVAISALSRLQNDALRLNSYFLKSYTLTVALTVPITIFSALFAEDIVHVVLGPKWDEAIAPFRNLTPTILVFSILNPTYWLMVSTGRHLRSLYLACAIAPIVMVAYTIGLPYGPNGVALAFSIAMSLWCVPHVFWCLHETEISPRGLFGAAWKPFAAVLFAAVPTLLFHHHLGQAYSPLFRLIFDAGILGTAYLLILTYALGQKQLYLDLLRSLLPGRLFTPRDRGLPVV
jgi:O-antigen/teichoic acid export membrane protein